MRLKAIALVFIAVCLLISETANAGGISSLVDSFLESFATKKSERGEVGGAGSIKLGRKLTVPEQRILIDRIRTGGIEGRISANDADFGGLHLSGREPKKTIIITPDQIPQRDVQKVSFLYDEATQQILDDLRTAGPLNEQQVEIIINNGVRKTIKNNERLEFDIPTGMLKVNLSFPTAYGNVTVKEIPIYKISGVVAVPVLLCFLLDAPLFKECIEAAVGTAKLAVAKELGLEATRAVNKLVPDGSQINTGE